MLFCCTAANAEYQYGYCLITKYFEYTDAVHATHHGKITINIWWKSDFNTHPATALSSFGKSDEPPTKYQLGGLQTRSAFDRSDWNIRKVDEDDPKDKKWIITGYGFKQDIVDCDVRTSPIANSYDDNSNLRAFQQLFQKGGIITDKPAAHTTEEEDLPSWL